MNRYKLIASYNNQDIVCKKDSTFLDVTVPMLLNDKLLYGLQNIIDKMYAQNIYPTEDGFDIMSLATMVYMADTRIARVIHGQDSWTREISIEIPVKNLNKWKNNIGVIERMLRFLTGDIWKISFSQRLWNFINPNHNNCKTNKFDKVSLFSGGMDSLISTINLLEDKKNVLLISHACDGLTKKSQSDIVKKLDDLYPDFLHTWMNLWMSFPKNYIPEGGMDTNTRSRSFLFIGFAIFTMTGIENVHELLIPENGLIALNVPLDPTRAGSFSTRTTHPFYLNLWNTLLKGLELNLSVRNPYWNKTKGEMASECKNKTVLFETMKLSFSCSSPTKARWKGLSPMHCGYCVPCLIRRAAMYKAFKGDPTEYTEKSISKMQKNSSNGIGIQLRSFQFAINRIKNNPQLVFSLIHMPGPLQQDKDYLHSLAGVYERGLLEVDDFIQKTISKKEDKDVL